MSMKRIKTSISLFIALCLVLCLCPAAFAVVSQSDSFYAADYANVLSNDTEQMICNYNGALEQQCDGAQVVVVTVDYLDGMYSDEYAYQLFNDWGVGSAENNNGMLLLLATAENKAWLAYGMGLNSRIDSDDVDDMLEEYFWEDFDRGEYDAAVQKLFAQLLKWYDGVYGSNVANSAPTASGMGHGGGGYYDSGSNYYGGAYDNGSRLVSTVITIAVIAIVFSAIFGGSRRRRYGYRNSGGSWLPWFLLFNSQRNNSHRHHGWDDDDHFPPFGGGFGGGRGGFGGGSGFGGGGFGGGSGFGGGGFSGGGGGRR